MNKSIRKILFSLATIFVIVTISFLLIHFMPGDPIISLVGQEEYYYLLENNPSELERIVEKYGLNDKLHVQFIKYLKSIAKLDFGIAYHNKRPVTENVLRACKNTLMLAIPAWIIGGILGCVLGTFAGWKPGGKFDRVSTPVFLLANTIPSNCLGLILLTIFSYKLRVFPINGMVSPGLFGIEKVKSMIHHMALPLIILIIFRTASNFMLMKSSVSQIRKEDYILTARSKGMGEKTVLFKHLLRNALIPYGTSFFIQMGYLLSGSMIIETIFGWKGMGLLMTEAVSKKDFPTAQLCFLIAAIGVVFGNLISDIFNQKIDPRYGDGN